MKHTQQELTLILKPIVQAHKQTYQVETISVTQEANGYLLNTPTGAINLQQGDIIRIPIGLFAVEIIKKNSVVNPEPANDESYIISNNYENIFGKPSSLQSEGLLSYQGQVQDPLAFLYGNLPLVQPKNYIGLIPQAVGVGALPGEPMASLQSPMPTMQIQDPKVYLEQSPMDMLDEFLVNTHD